MVAEAFPQTDSPASPQELEPVSQAPEIEAQEPAVTPPEQPSAEQEPAEAPAKPLEELTLEDLDSRIEAGQTLSPDEVRRRDTLHQRQAQSERDRQTEANNIARYRRDALAQVQTTLTAAQQAAILAIREERDHPSPRWENAEGVVGQAVTSASEQGYQYAYWEMRDDFARSLFKERVGDPQFQARISRMTNAELVSELIETGRRQGPSDQFIPKTEHEKALKSTRQQAYDDAISKITSGKSDDPEVKEAIKRLGRGAPPSGSATSAGARSPDVILADNQASRAEKDAAFERKYGFKAPA